MGWQLLKGAPPSLGAARALHKRAGLRVTSECALHACSGRIAHTYVLVALLNGLFCRKTGRVPLGISSRSGGGLGGTIHLLPPAFVKGRPSMVMESFSSFPLSSRSEGGGMEVRSGWRAPLKCPPLVPPPKGCVCVGMTMVCHYTKYRYAAFLHTYLTAPAGRGPLLRVRTWGTLLQREGGERRFVPPATCLSIRKQT